MDMIHGPLAGKILRFAVPLALSSMLQQLFNAADLAVVVRTPPQDGTGETVVELALPSNAAAISAKLCGLKGEFRVVDSLSTEFKDALGRQRWPKRAQNLPSSWQRYWQTRAAIVAAPAELDGHLADRDAALKAFSEEFERFRDRLSEPFAAKLRNWLDSHLNGK